jgi:hypothetical protein
VKLELSVSDTKTLSRSTSGLSTWPAYCRIMVDVPGITVVRFNDLTITDEGAVFANAVSIVLFFSQLMRAGSAKLYIHDEPRAFAMGNASKHTIFNSEDNSVIDCISNLEAKRLISYVDLFFEKSLRSTRPDLCDFLVQHKFLRDGA